MPVSKARKKTAFVPRIIFRAAIVGAGVVPMCVVACGGETTGQGGGDSGIFGVGAIFSDGGGRRDSVAAIGFEAGNGLAQEGGFPSVAEMGFDVAEMAFDGFPSVAEMAFDGFPSVAEMAFDGFPSVAAIGFDGGDARTFDASVAEAAFRGDARLDGVADRAFANDTGVGDSSSGKDALIFTVAAHGFEGGGD
jgi:hypothetical protein